MRILEALQESTRALARVLHSAEMDFGILYEAERNTGNVVSFDVEPGTPHERLGLVSLGGRWSTDGAGRSSQALSAPGRHA